MAPLPKWPRISYTPSRSPRFKGMGFVTIVALGASGRIAQGQRLLTRAARGVNACSRANRIRAHGLRAGDDLFYCTQRNLDAHAQAGLRIACPNVAVMHSNRSFGNRQPETHPPGSAIA